MAHSLIKNSLMWKLAPFRAALFLVPCLLTGCTQNFLNLGDVPERKAPPLSQEEAKSEIEALKAENQAFIAFETETPPQ